MKSTEQIVPLMSERGRRSSLPSGGAGIGVYRPRALSPGVDQILKIQGYVDPARIRPAVHAAAETAAGIVARMSAAEVHYRRIAIRRCADGVLTLVDDTRLQCPAFDRYLADCTETVAFVLTLGGAIDQVEGNMTANGQMLEAVLLESACWMAIEQATKRFAAHLRGQIAPDGLTLSRRLAPGYSVGSGARRWEWPLTDQAALFGLFGDAPLPVRLLESCMMTPKMSRSGLYGLRPKIGPT